ncbi:DUF1080 domain-containing protein [Mucilaginibacter terrenus]|uniref:DUF1080 domain-containing protein n=1 Tax=Mucilaginibacter terrenus TaxID=2482727 RepID=A0A3E2NPL9_9SPHI|nr:DUF1080 domain-containing protein [Mucilaginibacter terrenus]RFZ82938.1 DUF1080 domain-containing protein [Mucilaginibacter terrenus]
MNKLLACLCCVLCLVTGSSFQPASEWTPLLDKTLSSWEIYQSFYHKLGYKGQAPTDENGKLIEPIGYNKNQANVFSVDMVSGEPVLHVTGEIYGCVFTKQEFENYHLRLKYKWGEKKWVPRIYELKDSGLLYHSQGPAGVEYWRSWMLSQEFQIIEHSPGDYWSQASSQADIHAVKDSSYRFDTKGPLTSFGGATGHGGFCQAGTDMDKVGEWNQIDLITYGDKSLQIVNGKVVNALSGSRYKDGDVLKPLIKGKLQLQSEAAEIYYKDIQIKSIKGIPAEYAAYFK